MAKIQPKYKTERTFGFHLPRTGGHVKYDGKPIDVPGADAIWLVENPKNVRNVMEWVYVEDTQVEPVVLDGLTKAQLLTEARKYQLELDPKTKNEDIVKAIKERLETFGEYA